MVYNSNYLSENLKRGLCVLEQYGYIHLKENGIAVYAVPGDEISVTLSHTEIRIVYDTEPHFYMALARTMGMECGTHAITPVVEELGFMLDCSRNAVPKPEMVKRLICLLVLAGYNYLELYTEETYELPDEPYFGYKRGRYSAEELKDIIVFGEIFGLEMVPCIQTLAHLKNLANWKPYFDHMDIDDILLVGDERTYALIRKCLRFCKDTFHTNRINIGGDEAFHLGRGKYIDVNGYKDKNDIYLDHMQKVFELCKEEGLCPEFWADGLLDEDMPRERAKSLFDGTQVPITWGYQDTEGEEVRDGLAQLKMYSEHPKYAGACWKWFGYAPFNAYSEKAMDVTLQVAIEAKVKDILMTTWGDNGNECSVFAIIPSMWYATQKLFLCDADISRVLMQLTGYTSEEWKITDKLNTVMPDLDKRSNAAKYLLHNDFLIGLLDYNIPDHAGEIYRGLLPEFSRLAMRNSSFAYIFKSYEALCRVLIRKSTYSRRLYRAYQQQDKVLLASMVEELREIKTELQAFYDAYREFWLQDYKGFGFEVMDVRIGGLLARIQTVTVVLRDYLAGRTEHIYELEEERIEYFCGQLQGDEVYAPMHGCWATAYTVNHI